MGIFPSLISQEGKGVPAASCFQFVLVTVALTLLATQGAAYAEDVPSRPQRALALVHPAILAPHVGVQQGSQKTVRQQRRVTSFSRGRIEEAGSAKRGPRRSPEGPLSFLSQGTFVPRVARRHTISKGPQRRCSSKKSVADSSVGEASAPLTATNRIGPCVVAAEKASQLHVLLCTYRI